ncbi:MAG: glutaminase A [Pseudomonadota bacterium]
MTKKTMKRQGKSPTETNRGLARSVDETPCNHTSGHEPESDAITVDEHEERLFKSLDYDNDKSILPGDLKIALSEIGLASDDYRLRESMAAIDEFLETRRSREEDDNSQHIPKDTFVDAVRHNIILIERALQGKMVIPDFKGFCDEIDEIYELTRQNRDGNPASYIPQLDVGEPDVDRFAVSLCTVDGQRHSVGDSDHFFTVQSSSKPISYCLALENHGADFVHRYVGQEPSGSSFNELALDKDNKPHNPMINAGAIMSSALVSLGEMKNPDSDDARSLQGNRFETVMKCWQALSGEEKPRFSTPVYLSERETADRNHALAYFMREKNAFPPDIDMHDVLDFYFQTCAIEINSRMMSVIAATLANGGICPVTGERVFSSETVRCCLSMMASCGMYEYSGEFAFVIGLPAKSSVSGVVMVVVPNVMGFCVWSPRLDEVGNSVRGIDFFKHLVDRFNFHNFDSLSGLSSKRDPRLNTIQQKARLVNEMILASSKGDVGAILEQLRRGSKIGSRDYDLRTPLHLAAAENQVQVVRFFVEQADSEPGSLDINARDRWGGTPLDDAYLQNHREVISILEVSGARRGDIRQRTESIRIDHSHDQLGDPLKTGELIWAASEGDLVAVRKLVAQGVSLDVADYDRRTPIHLAAAEGYRNVVRYILAHGGLVNPIDRWGNTPLDEAHRHGQTETAKLLSDNGGKRFRSIRSANDGSHGADRYRRKRAA